jgi:heat shock protein HslJ
VITQGHPTHVDLVLEMVSQMPATPPAGSAPSLAGTSWVLIELAAQRAAPRPAVGAQRPTLVFGTDGRVSGNTGCNSYNGPYSQEGSELSIGPLVSTLRACIDPDLAAQEQVMMAVLSDSPLDATQEGSRLTLAAPAGTLVFIKATVQNEEPVQPGMPRSGAPGPGGPVELFALAMLSIGLGLGGLRLLKSSHRDRRL